MPDKVLFQLSIDPILKERLRNISKQRGIHMARIVSDLLESHLTEIEERYGVQPQLQKPGEE